MWLGTNASQVVALAIAHSTPGGITWSRTWVSGSAWATWVLFCPLIGAVLVSGLMLTSQAVREGGHAALIRTVVDVAAVDVLMFMVDEIFHMAVWPLALIVLTFAAIEHRCRGALIAWAATVPVLTAGPLLEGNPAAAMFVCAVTLIFSINIGILSQTLSRRTAELETAYAHMHLQARADPLTGLLNRAAIQEWADAPHQASDVAVLVIDLDGFKAVNDMLGHQAGDAVLGEIAQRLTDAVLTGRQNGRSGSLVARTGGDEFLVVTPATSPEDAESLRARLSSVLTETPVIDRCPAHFGASIGVAQGRVDSFHSLERLVRAADVHMYGEKFARKTATRAA